MKTPPLSLMRSLQILAWSLLALIAFVLLRPQTAHAAAAASTAGVPAGSVLTARTGDIYINTAGTVIDLLDIKGCVTITANNVTIKRSKITCSGDIAAVTVRAGNAQLLDNDITHSRNTNAAVLLYDATSAVVKHNNISGGSDNIMINGGGSHMIEENDLHDTAISAAVQSEAIQILSGNSITVRHNWISVRSGSNSSGGKYTGGVFIKNDYGSINGVTVENNQFNGGIYSVYCIASNEPNLNSLTGPGPATPPTNCKIRNNTFKQNSFAQGAIILNDGEGNEAPCNIIQESRVAVTVLRRDVSPASYQSHVDSSCNPGPAGTDVTPTPPPPTPTPTPPTPTPPPPSACGNDPIVCEDFSASNSANKFTMIDGGSWNITNQQGYIGTPGDGGFGKLGTKVIHNTNLGEDYDLSIDGRVVDTNSAFNDFGVVFGFRDRNNYNFVSFGESNDGGVHGIFEVVNGVSREVGDMIGKIYANQTYNVTLTRRGNTVSAQLNGNAVASATVSNANGRVGFGSRNDRTYFDNLSVSRSGTPTPPPPTPTPTPPPPTPPTPTPPTPTPTPPTPTPPPPTPTPPTPPPSLPTQTCYSFSNENGLVEYTQNIPTTGNYTVWVRMKSPDSNAPVVMNIDSTNKAQSCAAQVRDSGKVNDSTWTWVNKKIDGSKFVANLNAGNTKVQLAGHPDYNNVKIDRVLLVLNDSCTPTDKGDNCANNSTPTPPPPTPTPPTPTPPTPTPPPPSTPAGTTLRINAGGSGFTDNTGRAWIADTYYKDGSTVARGNISISGTDNDRVYQFERWGTTGYRIPVINGTYEVKLHFAETYEGITRAGQRVFTASVEGNNLGQVDVYGETGGRNRALVKTANVTVSDSTLNIDFGRVNQDGMINGIEIVPTGAATPPPAPTPPPSPPPSSSLPTLRINTGGSAYTDPSGQAWMGDSYSLGGSVVDRGPITISNTNNQHIYRSERWGMQGYAVPVPNGTYAVNLHFAETYEGITRAGQRVFSVGVEGVNLGNVDAYGETGGRNRALVKSATVTVNDGTLNIHTTKVTLDGMINGIEIIGQ